MAILFSNEIINAVIDELKNAENSVQIITAYCKKNTFEKLDSVISSSVNNRRLLVRFRLDDVLKGSTDFEILEYGVQHGWNVFLRFDLHAKTYIVDNKRGLVGSANATNSGLNIGKAGNMEMATFIDVELEDIEKINGLFDDAIPVDGELITKMKQQFDSIEPAEKQKSHSWNTEITNRFNPSVNTLFSYELPEEFNFVEGEYFSFLDYTFSGDLNAFKEVFRWSNAYLWLLKIVKENDGEMYFGAVTEKLHNALVTDPKPYRRDVKQMLANLLDLIEKLGMEEVVIDRPNHSQRIALKEK
ncbi:phospholipase D family protein [Lachnospira multipara]|uniref:phospholipase D family protein n=1 Tax=Lachnospira multipara TaxID=28051 RepID=UPI0004E2696F|nr:phospholipase D family protein [Lachnospira multipara]